MTDSGDGIHSRIGFGSKLGYLQLGAFCDGEKDAWKSTVKWIHRGTQAVQDLKHGIVF